MYEKEHALHFKLCCDLIDLVNALLEPFSYNRMLLSSPIHCGLLKESCSFAAHPWLCTTLFKQRVMEIVNEINQQQLGAKGQMNAQKGMVTQALAKGVGKGGFLVFFV